MAEEVSTSNKGTSRNGKWQQGSKASQTAAGTLDSAKEAFNTVTEKASEYMSGFDANPVRFVRQYPVQAAIGGIVIGFLLGTAVSRRTLA